MDQDPGKDFQILKDFLESKNASRKAVNCLKSGVEIQIVIEPETVCAFFSEQGEPKVERRVADSPDVEFRLTPGALERLSQKPADDMGAFGIEVVKEYIKGDVRIRVLGSAFSMLKNGYIKIIKEAGPTFFKFIAENGVNNLSKLPDIFKKLRG